MGLWSYLGRISYSRDIESQKKKLKTDSDRASLPVLPVEKFSYRPIGKEKLVAVHDRVLDYNSANRHRPRPRGLFSELFYMLSSDRRQPFSVSNLPRELKERFMGRLLLTDKAIVFESASRNERITFAQVSNVQFHPDGFTVMKRNGSPRVYQISSPDPKFAAILDLLLSRIE